jgi:hypothetical protein
MPDVLQAQHHSVQSASPRSYFPGHVFAVPFFHTDMDTMIALSETSLLLAEARIAGCEHCTDRATTPFSRVVHEVTGMTTLVAFVLPAPALCPMCLAAITELSFVQLREDAPELKIYPMPPL